MGLSEAMQDMDYFDGWNDHDVLTDHFGGEPCGCTKCAVARGDQAADDGVMYDTESTKPVHWAGEPGEGPTSLHGNGAASFARTSGDEDDVTCKLCLTLLARGEHRAGSTEPDGT